jgi:hypothetical protein
MIDTDDPTRQKDRKDTDEPRCVNSITDRENREPNLDMPKTEQADPSRAKLLIDSDEPKCKKSITDMEEPRRENPLSDSVEPKFT